MVARTDERAWRRGAISKAPVFRPGPYNHPEGWQIAGALGGSVTLCVGASNRDTQDDQAVTRLGQYVGNGVADLDCG
jgi:hypothetical protein